MVCVRVGFFEWVVFEVYLRFRGCCFGEAIMELREC